MLHINKPIYQTILAHLQNQYPLEACGLLAGTANGRVTHHYPIDNILQSQTAYEMDPRQQIEAMLTIEANNQQLLAIYHSHPHSPPYPSPTDVAYAYYPEAIQLIISLLSLSAPQTRAFTIQEGQINEVAYLIE